MMTQTKASSLIARLLGCGLGLAVLLPANPNKLSPDLQELKSSAPVDVIVRVKAGARARLASFLRTRGVQLKADLEGIASLNATVAPSALAQVAADAEVEYIALDREVRASLDTAVPTTGAVAALQAGLTGNGVGVAVIDSGVSREPDLVHALVYEESFLPSGRKGDDYGHGTHVASVLAGSGLMSLPPLATRTFRGMAPGIQIVSLRVLDENGVGKDEYVIRAIDRAIQLRDRFHIKVINLSLGRPVFESYMDDPLCQAVERAWRAGIAVVVAAGNFGRINEGGRQGYATVNSPANHPLVITVGAMNDKDTPARSDDQMTSYSSKGPTAVDRIVKPDIVAPGNRVIAAGPHDGSLFNLAGTRVPWSEYTRLPLSGFSYSYFRLSGTSIAAPTVSGTIALMIQNAGKQNQTLSPDTIKARLMRTATKNFPATTVVYDTVTNEPYVVNYDIFTVGAGYLSAWEAINSTAVVPAGMTAASPTAVPVARGDVRLVQTQNAVWGNSAVWGSNAVWGNSAVWGSMVEAYNAVWGNSAVWGSNAVWGNSAVWGSTPGILANGDK